MAEITASAVKALREDTGLGMMECKKALEEAKGDPSVAKDLLRKRFGDAAKSKAGRTTKEGLVAVVMQSDRKAATMIEVNCETDFCARNPEFSGMVKDLAEMAAASAPGNITPTPAMADRLQGVLAKIRENMGFARGVKIAADKVGAYVHHNGKVGVLVGVNGELDDAVLQDVCMHIAFADPLAITPDQVPADLVRERKAVRHRAGHGQRQAQGHRREDGHRQDSQISRGQRAGRAALRPR